MVNFINCSTDEQNPLIDYGWQPCEFSMVLITIGSVLLIAKALRLMYNASAMKITRENAFVMKFSMSPCASHRLGWSCKDSRMLKTGCECHTCAESCSFMHHAVFIFLKKVCKLCARTMCRGSCERTAVRLPDWL